MANVETGDQRSEAEKASPQASAAPDRSFLTRPMRADALKNRERILEAAQEVFAREGLAVPIDVVAEKAGVGVGTLYRHFPGKEALFEAIVIDRMTQLAELATTLVSSNDPGGALCFFFRELAAQASAKRDLFDAIGSAGIDVKSDCSELMEELMSRIDALVQRAAVANAIRSDVSVKELVSLFMGTCHAAGDAGLDDAAVQRMVGVILDGLRVESP